MVFEGELAFFEFFVTPYARFFRILLARFESFFRHIRCFCGPNGGIIF